MRRVLLEVRLADAVHDVFAVRRKVEVRDVRDAHQVVDRELRGLGRGGGERERGAGQEAGEGETPSHGQSFVGDPASARNFSRA